MAAKLSGGIGAILIGQAAIGGGAILPDRIEQSAPSFSQKATETIAPPKIAELNQVGTGFSNLIDAFIDLDTSTGAIDQTGTGFTTQLVGELTEVTFGDISQQAPSFNQNIVTYTPYSVFYADITTNTPAFTQNIDGSVQNVTVTADISQNSPKFGQISQLSLLNDSISGQIDQLSTPFSQLSSASNQNKTVSAELSQNLPTFTQSGAIEYSVSSANITVDAYLPQFTQKAVSTVGRVINNEAPAFNQGVRANITKAITGVIDPESVTTGGTMAYEDVVANFWDIDTAITMDLPHTMTMDAQTNPAIVDLSTVRRVNLYYQTESDLTQQQEMNYVSDSIA